MPTIASTNLNRILRITANLLFEKKEDPKDVIRLLEGFVSPSMVREWYKKYCETNGINRNTNLKTHKRRMPMPPIDWNSVEIKKLDQMLNDDKDCYSPEPEW